MRWANTVIWMDTGANYLIWTDTRGQLFDLDRCEGPTLWFGWTPGAIFFYLDGYHGPTLWFGWIPRANSLIWVDTLGQLFDCTSYCCLLILHVHFLKRLPAYAWSHRPVTPLHCTPLNVTPRHQETASYPRTNWFAQFVMSQQLLQSYQLQSPS